MGIRPRQDKGSQLTTTELDNAFEGLDNGKAPLVHVHVQSDVTGLVAALAGKEASLGNPGVNGYVLSSTTLGVRSWIAAGAATWGGITGTLSAQTDLQNALNAKAPTVSPTFTTSATFSFLTTGRVPYATAGGQIIDSANFLYDGTTHTIQAAVAATSTDGLVLATTATATSGNQKYSPRIRFSGSYFSGSAKTTDWTVENLPNASGGVLAFYHSDNGASYAVKLTLGSDGSVNAVDVLASGQVQVVSTGAINATGYCSASTKIIGFSSTTNTNLSQDVILMREAAANLRLGGTASATPVAQTLSVQDASGSNISTVNWTLRGSRATGSGTAGKLIVQVDNNVNPGASTLHTATNTFQVGWDGIGYATGCGGAVTQTTGRTTGVTLDKPTGAITLVSAAGSATWQSFTVTNNTVAATDTVVVSQKSGTDLYMIFVTAVAAGSFRISFATTGGTTTEQPVFNFAVIKAVAS